MHRVVGLCLEGTVAFDLTAPLQAFRGALDANHAPLYEIATCSVDGAPVGTTTEFSLSPQGDLGLLEDAETIVVPGYFAVLDPPHAEALEALRHASARGTRVISICTGAFALAHAGLVDGRRATTHWRWTGELAARFPAVSVDPGVLYVDEGRVMTSAGLSAGIDLGLHVIREDFGAAVGESAARNIVAAPHREGGQAQFFKPEETMSEGSLEPTRRWIAERLREPLDVAAMSRHARVSPRTFARRFRAETGTTPLQWLLAQRVLEARRLLEQTDLPIEAVAWRSGFGNAASLRDHFRRATATTPSAYRRTFSPA
jgi:AraC family transcriptional activator FtrA